jgi:hypothetical protein
MQPENSKPGREITALHLEAGGNGLPVSLGALVDTMAAVGMNRITLSSANGLKLDMVKSEGRQWKLTLSG